MTICLPAAIAARACLMPTAGLPVASTITSILPEVALAASAVKVVAAIRVGIPADGAAGLARALRIEIDDHGHFQPRRMRHLRQKHRAELAGADQRHANGFAGGKAGVEQTRRFMG